MTRQKLDWKRSGALIVMAISLLTAGWWLGRGQAAHEAHDASAASADAPERSAAEREPLPDDLIAKQRPSSAPLSGSLNAAVEQPLPDLSIPFAEVIDELKARADRGDAKAACRLANEAIYCRDEVSPAHIRTDEQIAEMVASRTNPRDNEKQVIRAMMQQRDTLVDKLTHCAGVDRAIAGRAPFYHLQAANAGHIRSMMAIANPSTHSLAANMITDPSLAHLYQQNMLPMLRRALQSGDVVALVTWNHAIAFGTGMPLQHRLPDSMRNSAVPALLLARVHVELDEDPLILRALDAAQVAATSDDIAEANDFYDRYFRDSPRFKSQKETALERRARSSDAKTPPPSPPDDRLECDRGWEREYDAQ